MMKQLIFILMFVLTLSALGYGQNFVDFAVGEGHTDEALMKCGSLPTAFPTAGFYNPAQTSYTKAVSYFTVNRDHWACMWTGARYQWKAEPAGSQYGKTANGDFSFEGFAAKGLRACHNRVLAIFYAEEKVEPPPPPTPTPVPFATPTPLPPPPMCANRNLTLAQADSAGLIRVDKGNGIISCELPAAPVAEKEDCPECPKDAKVKPFASTTTRLTGGLMATGTSAGIACGVSGLLNKSLKDCLIDAGISASAGRVVQAVNPSPDSVRVTVNGDTKKFRKGKEGKVGGCELTWEGNEAVLTCDGQECKRVPLYRNFNTTVFAMKRGNKTPVKTQTQSQIPAGGDTIASNNGGLTPGGGVPVLPGNGIPTRPRRNFASSEAANSSNQSNSSFAAQNKPACSGQLIKIRGEYRCVTN